MHTHTLASPHAHAHNPNLRWALNTRGAVFPLGTDGESRPSIARRVWLVVSLMCTSFTRSRYMFIIYIMLWYQVWDIFCMSGFEWDFGDSTRLGFSYLSKQGALCIGLCVCLVVRWCAQTTSVRSKCLWRTFAANCFWFSISNECSRVGGFEFLFDTYFLYHSFK